MAIKLSKFIKNLEGFSKRPMNYIATENGLFEIIYAILYKIAELTIIDTGQARYLVISKFAQKYNKSYEELSRDWYNYWTNREREGRDWGNNSDRANLKESLSPNSYNMKLIIDDDGLFAQENATRDGEYQGQQYPSEHPTKVGRDNSQFKVRHIQYITDVVNNGDFGEIDKLNWNKVIDKIIFDIEKGLFR